MGILPLGQVGQHMGGQSSPQREVQISQNLTKLLCVPRMARPRL